MHAWSMMRPHVYLSRESIFIHFVAWIHHFVSSQAPDDTKYFLKMREIERQNKDMKRWKEICIALSRRKLHAIIHSQIKM